ncbi:MAG: triose-phosphate isomerase [Pseudomonadales bacterium]|nr:triose-phosphate isomerase [Pseudomonadales bacterium]
MRSKLVVGNWKMHGTRESCSSLILALKQGLDGVPEGVEIGIAPPSVYLPLAAKLCADTRIQTGAQNASQFEQGAYTGEVACGMLADLGADFVIVGHSERRALFGESDAVVAEKFAAVQAASLQPILCVGETLEQRKEGITADVVMAQLAAVLERVGVAAFENAVIAYEPVWAIGTGEKASPEQAQEVHALLRSDLAKQDKEIAAAIQILYGGSVKESNSAELIAQPDIDGGLVGGASLEAEQFLAICTNADN